MLIQPISNNQQSFKAVNQEYFAWAKKEYRLCKNVSTEWIQRLSYDVYLFKKISHQDAIDTIEAVREYMGKIGVGTADLLESLKKTKPNP